MKGASFASDIWSVGGVVIEMIGGMPPFADKYGRDMDVGELLKRIAIDGKPNYPTKITPLARDFLDQIFVPADKRPSADKLLQHPYV
jgi:mitogen-activated protein kinase kinase kinase 2